MRKQRADREPSRETESTTQRAAGRNAPPDVPPTSPNDTPASSQPPISAQQSRADRAGVDARQRGWYWHWNGIVTQYAPLIGLKGVGLLNSYTVWTDRREQSPTRGYAFPTQQAEADFYGEDRAELITINKILVALDLIEIRKEMVQRTDPQGRKWKVPHNLYRVKDRPEGLELRTEDVLRVVELASRDAAVYRYVRRIFSGRFAPIDRDNIWRRILSEVADDPTWRELSDKTARSEARASARSRAGHKARAKQAGDTDSERPSVVSMTAGQLGAATSAGTEHTTVDTDHAQTSDAQTNNGLDSRFNAVAPGNSGSGTDVDTINSGSQGGDVSSAEATNNGQESVVAPGNATYYQEISTTTTTTPAKDDLHADGTASREERTDHLQQEPGPEGAARGASPNAQAAGPLGLDNDSAPVQSGDESGALPAGRAAHERRLADPAANGPLVDPSPLVVSLFEAANNRGCSPLERMLLGELERDAGAAAARCGESGADWVAAALREAVSSGSAFVAPKRISEIVKRWAALGSRPGFEPPASPALDARVGDEPPEVRVRLPRGRDAARVWERVLADMGQVLDDASHTRLFSGSRISGYRDGTVEIEAAPQAASKLASEYCSLLQRRLEQHIGGPVTVVVRPAALPEGRTGHAATSPIDPIVISRADAEQGKQLWRAVLSEIGASTDLDDLARLRGALPLGQDESGRIVIGAPTSFAARLIDGRCRKAIEAALQAVLGTEASVQVAGRDGWMIENEGPTG